MQGSRKGRGLLLHFACPGLKSHISHGKHQRSALEHSQQSPLFVLQVDAVGLMRSSMSMEAGLGPGGVFLTHRGKK